LSLISVLLNRYFSIKLKLENFVLIDARQKYFYPKRLESPRIESKM